VGITVASNTGLLARPVPRFRRQPFHTASCGAGKDHLDVLRLKLRRFSVKMPLAVLAAKVGRLLDEYAKSPRRGINATGGMACQ
jgi:hypothetical protein